MSNDQKRVRIIKVIFREGVIELLRYLKDKGPGRFSDLAKKLNKARSSKTVSSYLHDLLDLELINKTKDKNGTIKYSITPRGELALFRVEQLMMFGKAGRGRVFFDEKKDKRRWYFAAYSVALAAQEELLMVTRWLRSLQENAIRHLLFATFETLNNKGVSIKIIADPGLSKDLRSRLMTYYNVRFRFIDAKLLENPPGILKPVIFPDFSHVMIADRRDWLYVYPHKEEGSHKGIYCMDDPPVAKYLAEIFDAFWQFGKKIID